MTSQMNKSSNDLKLLFKKAQLESWFEAFIDFCNQHPAIHLESTTLCHDWSLEQQQSALNFFSGTRFIQLVNAIFFYKLYPEKLFLHEIYPQKLISIRIRLGILHYYIELIQQQLYSHSIQNSLLLSIDHLFHGDELPPGVTIEVNECFRGLIQEAIKKINPTISSLKQESMGIDRVHALLKAYKFWFNPNRLIDAVMVLRQNLIAETDELWVFEQEMLKFFAKLSTSECLELYGYFANKDTRYLLHTFFSMTQSLVFDWLPLIHEEELSAIIKVFHSLRCVMEALRTELKNRHIITEPYIYYIEKESIYIGHRTRDAIFRSMAIYKIRAPIEEVAINNLFQALEEPI